MKAQRSKRAGAALAAAIVSVLVSGWFAGCAYNPLQPPFAKEDESGMNAAPVAPPGPLAPAAPAGSPTTGPTTAPTTAAAPSAPSTPASSETPAAPVVPAIPAGASVPGTRAALIGATWQWTGMTTTMEELNIYASDRYTVRFLETGHLQLRADCNRGSGSWSVPGEGQIAIGPIALTRMACEPGSLSDRFASSVDSADRFHLQGGDLYLDLPGDAGSLRLQKQAQP